ncbi:hypothetical protein [Rothia sp. (in: high G+C Gram-positive bacteria)]|uniref:hypothetical protein n=1 Tax=Rothia sp. (in: high G+C Gram-positive bacteria) TaxID=1885016 RepID=UPI000EEF5687|nr:hypothetical protein [Rothia sp. (in: high G+C Gram-positive bacteria)]
MKIIESNAPQAQFFSVEKAYMLVFMGLRARLLPSARSLLIRKDAAGAPSRNEQGRCTGGVLTGT